MPSPSLVGVIGVCQPKMVTFRLTPRRVPQYGHGKAQKRDSAGLERRELPLGDKR
jgi:hypothetical protein